MAKSKNTNKVNFEKMDKELKEAIKTIRKYTETNIIIGQVKNSKEGLCSFYADEKDGLKGIDDIVDCLVFGLVNMVKSDNDALTQGKIDLAYLILTKMLYKVIYGLEAEDYYDFGECMPDDVSEIIERDDVEYAITDTEDLLEKKENRKKGCQCCDKNDNVFDTLVEALDDDSDGVKVFTHKLTKEQKTKLSELLNEIEEEG